MARYLRASVPVSMLGIVAALAAPAAGEANDRCGTVVRPGDVPLALDRQMAGLYEPETHQPGPYVVPVTFHVVRRSDGTGGITETRLVRALDDLNAYFTGAGILFCWPGPTDYIDDDNFYAGIDTRAEIDALRGTHVAPGTLNVYFTPNLADESGALCGVSSFTWSAVQGVVIDNDCLVPLVSNNSELAHQVGHYFDLLHTHETAFGWECPACTDGTYQGRPCNCNLAGDLLCDTPADPGLGPDNVDAGCNYVGTATDPCVGSPYSPDPRNLMSSAPGVCRDRFTPQQAARVRATLEYLRPDHVAPSCPGGNQWGLEGKLLALDGVEDDRFGTSVALDGDRIVVGAPYDDENGQDSGSAYVFWRSNGVWIQEQKLLPDDGAAGDWFGYSVAIAGDWIVVGSLWDSSNHTDYGAAYVFHRVNGVWIETQQLLAPDGAGRGFGVSVALDAGRLVVGAYLDRALAGSAYLFRLDNGTWVYEQKVRPTDGRGGGLFGGAVDIAGDRTAIGAPWDNDLGSFSGSAHVFHLDNGAWIDEQKLLADDGGTGDVFGSAIALDGARVIVGADFDSDLANGAGSAYIFRLSGGAWAQEQKIHAADAGERDHFGVSVGISGVWAVVGAFGDKNENGVDAGAVYVFRRTAGTWVQQQKLLAPDGTSLQEFGISVALDHQRLVVGARHDGENGPYAGAAYAFRNLEALRMACAGDLNGDFAVDLNDLILLLNDFDCIGGGCAGDADRDGDTDLDDLSLLLQNFDTICP